MTTPNHSSKQDVAHIVEQLGSLRAAFQSMRDEIQKVIVGQEHVIETVLGALFLDGHVLLEGVPGLGKTLLVRTLGETLGLPFSRIQFTPDLMPADIVGTRLVQQEESGQMSFEFVPGPVFTNILLADEINRATPKTQSAMLEAMQERQVTVANDTHQMARPFLVMATMNPLEMEGTYPLPEAQLDRFLFKVQVPYPDKHELVQIGHKTTGAKSIEPQAVLSEPEKQLRGWSSLIRRIPLSTNILEFAANLILATHPENGNELAGRYIRFGASPRGFQALLLAGKLNAALEGRVNVSIKDVSRWVLPCLRHRVILNFDAESEGVSAEGVIEQILRGLD